MSAGERFSAWLAFVAQRMGLADVAPSRADLNRIAILLVTTALCAVTVVDLSRSPSDALQVGDVAPRTVKAPFTFGYPDHASHDRARARAGDSVHPVFVHHLTLAGELRERFSGAFTQGRRFLRERDARRLQEQEQERQDAGAATADSDVEGILEPLPLDAGELADLSDQFREALGVHVPDSAVKAIARAEFDADLERLGGDLLTGAMQHMIMVDRSTLPRDGRTITVVTLAGSAITEAEFSDFTQILSPAAARQQVSLGLLEGAGRVAGTEDGAIGATASLARALLRPNLSYDALQTETRRQEATASVQMELRTIKQGATLFRAGDTLSPEMVRAYAELQEHNGADDLFLELVAVALFLAIVIAPLYQFASSYLDTFSTQLRDVASVGVILVFTAVLAKLVVAGSESVALMVGYEAEARSVWFLVPVAGSAMLVRLLLGVSWTIVFSLVASLTCGLIMELSALHVAYFVVSCFVAAGAVVHTRERIAVLRAGFQVAVANAALVLVIHLLQLFVFEVELSLATTMRPVWSMSFAALGGLLSASLVLALVPLFESVGFVTDYRLMELANLNHPLLRQLMLRAPGTYHHSVLVGTLAEAACEAIGANALRAKVASYFHDIGKSLKPQYFVENQRDNVNQHDGLDPHSSAHIIISHVVDGGRMAREHRLPKPIIDNIYMHHGTGLLQYFYRTAKERAEDVSLVREEAFRYPGPKPDTREAGVIMLADKVEAATRTIREPNEENIRRMISRIISSVMADDQFSECPLTFQEIHQIHETFVRVLLGIYHQRIEYASTKDVSSASSTSGARGKIPPPPPPTKIATITLEIEPATKAAAEPVIPPVEIEVDSLSDVHSADEEPSDVVDYESLEHLPGSH
jgi:cyclic-di-AMP phosphodiesterase PgpH